MPICLLRKTNQQGESLLEQDINAVQLSLNLQRDTGHAKNGKRIFNIISFNISTVS